MSLAIHSLLTDLADTPLNAHVVVHWVPGHIRAEGDE